MIEDALTVMLKDLREFVFQRGGSSGSGRGLLRGGWLSILLMLGVFGIFLPLNFGREWIAAPASLIFWAWVPPFLVTSMTADSFAGERERHTLETLLASRLPDAAILYGKVAAAVVYGWGITIVGLALGIVTINAAFWSGSVLLFPPRVAAAGAVLALLTALLAAAAGTLISLRAPSVRQAAQTLSIAILMLVFVPTFGVRALPAEWQQRIAEMLTSANAEQIALGAAGVLLVLDVALLAVARARFQRPKLILD